MYGYWLVNQKIEVTLMYTLEKCDGLRATNRQTGLETSSQPATDVLDTVKRC
jgi:hypothetical protein